MGNSTLLELNECQLEELTIEHNPDHRKEDGPALPLPQPTVDFNTYVHRTDQNRFAVLLTIGSEAPEYPVRFSVRIVGFFTVAEPFSDGRVTAERAVNGLTILYGMVRSYLLTSAAWFSKPTLLPTVYFTDLVNARAAAAKKQSIASEGSQEALASPSAVTA